jgi:hypothetical protein
MVTMAKRPPAGTEGTVKRASGSAPVHEPRAATVEAPVDSHADATKPKLLRAGLDKLGGVCDDVMHRQSRVFEAILGIEPGQGWSRLVELDAAAERAAHEAFGLRKFQAVFDQRVARALERMGMPSFEALQALTDEVAMLKAELRSLKAAQRKR